MKRKKSLITIDLAMLSSMICTCDDVLRNSVNEYDELLG